MCGRVCAKVYFMMLSVCVRLSLQGQVPSEHECRISGPFMCYRNDGIIICPGWLMGWGDYPFL